MPVLLCVTPAGASTSLTTRMNGMALSCIIINLFNDELVGRPGSQEVTS